MYTLPVGTSFSCWPCRLTSQKEELEGFTTRKLFLVGTHITDCLHVGGQKSLGGKDSQTPIPVSQEWASRRLRQMKFAAI